MTDIATNITGDSSRKKCKSRQCAVEEGVKKCIEELVLQGHIAAEQAGAL